MIPASSAGGGSGSAGDRRIFQPAPERFPRRLQWRGVAAALGSIALAVGGMLVFYPGPAPTDAYVYLAAGERLNAGHSLYALQPGDREIGLNPPYWTVPTLSPPMLAVAWRPLAHLGNAGMLIGWALSGVAMLAALAVVTYRTRALGVIVAAVLAAPIGVQLGLGNVNGFVALGLVVLWIWRDRPLAVGAVLAPLVAVKLLPVMLVLWLIATRRYRAFAAFVGWSLIVLLVSVAGAGWTAHVEYLRIISETSAGGFSDWSLAGLARTAGTSLELARFAPWAGIALGVIVAIRMPRHSFAIAVALTVFGSPVVHPYWFALLPVALLPYAPGSGRRLPLGPVSSSPRPAPYLAG